ncbi:hypothetical protein CU102_14405 [Phyllobacterium brassicacearum]|uniref:Glycosyl transferase family 25 domain-containing protein n=1 Tax=Phyllobacterium brassicacearum TaxID=314235 RepID=A0A2P7BNS3_9HYPH|nr:glycosyltransferase family 25 protein [Phyllobacterium brassicacearum]PSH68119.1 hypothetical protein CU102_14405 [Phyllobacterium brassicacearum]TDQ29656.1 glycosyl transferase family 25 [Phyllobacterium brassicacearum]
MLKRNDERFRIYVLSLKSSTERRARIANMFSQMGISNWEFFTALGPELIQVPYNAQSAFKTRQSVLSAGEISCAASHIGMLQAFLTSDDKHALIMEDDVFFDPFFNVGGLPDVLAGLELDYLKLYARYFVPSRYVASVGRWTFYRGSWPLLGTQAYVISRRGANQFLKHLLSQPVLDRPIDDLMDRFWDTKLPITFIYPFPIMELGYGTTIHGAANRNAITAENRKYRELGSRIDAARSFIAKIVEIYDRKKWDRRFRAFDNRLSARIAGNEKQISDSLIRTEPTRQPPSGTTGQNAMLSRQSFGKPYLE